MDIWRTTTPRPILDVVTTEKRRDCNGNTIFTARLGLPIFREIRDFSLTEAENHVAVSLLALQFHCPKFNYRLVSFKITDERHGLFVFERLP
jgi:hypothetical protein